jgi:dUTP pyrophosphatase
MKRVPLKIKRLENFRGEIPKYETPDSSGFDVRSCLSETINLSPGERALIPTGLSFEIPSGFEIQVRPRSGLAIKRGLTLVNAPGTIDADYRGELKIIIINLGQEPFEIKDQERVAQCVLAPIVQAELISSENLSQTDRGSGGFGSTGLN